MTRPRHQQALVYSCSGCSSAAQLANHVALQLDRRGVANDFSGFTTYIK